MKKWLVLITCISVCFISYSQSCEKYFLNDSIKYTILRVRKKISPDKSEFVLFYSVVINMKQKLKDSLLKLEDSFWLDKLNHEKSDWATNIVMYFIFERDALPLAILQKNRNKWNLVKENEIRYWKKFLIDQKSR